MGLKGRSTFGGGENTTGWNMHPPGAIGLTRLLGLPDDYPQLNENRETNLLALRLRQKFFFLTSLFTLTPYEGGFEFRMGLRPTHGDESALLRFIDSKQVTRDF